MIRRLLIALREQVGLHGPRECDCDYCRYHSIPGVAERVNRATVRRVPEYGVMLNEPDADEWEAIHVSTVAGV